MHPAAIDPMPHVLANAAETMSAQHLDFLAPTHHPGNNIGSSHICVMSHPIGRQNAKLGESPRSRKHNSMVHDVLHHFAAMYSHAQLPRRSDAQ
jgi:hypothetical protein